LVLVLSGESAVAQLMSNISPKNRRLSRKLSSKLSTSFQETVVDSYSSSTPPPFLIPTLHIYAILQRISQQLEKYKYISPSFFNYLLGQLPPESDLDVTNIIDWIQRKLMIEVNSDEVYYLLYYIRIRLADPLFDYHHHHIFRAPSSRYYPRWSSKLKSLAYKYNVSPEGLHPNLPLPSEMITPKNQVAASPVKAITTATGAGALPPLTPSQSFRRKPTSHFFPLDQTASSSSLDTTSSSTSSSSFVSRLPQMKSTSQQIQQLLQEQKEINKHVNKIFLSKKLR
jgi:hypothetical protein